MSYTIFSKNNQLSALSIKIDWKSPIDVETLYLIIKNIIHNERNVVFSIYLGGSFFSEEIKNAEKYGYEFEILGGYVFESKDLFSDYISELNQIKTESSKDSAMYMIGKILMNSLFGRMGMNPFLGSSKFKLKNEYAKLLEKGDIKLDRIEDEVDYGNNVLVTMTSGSDKELGLEGNVSVAIAITAYSRALMSDVKNLPGVKLYYTDTDSIF